MCRYIYRITWGFQLQVLKVRLSLFAVLLYKTFNFILYFFLFSIINIQDKNFHVIASLFLMDLSGSKSWHLYVLDLLKYSSSPNHYLPFVCMQQPNESNQNLNKKIVVSHHTQVSYFLIWTCRIITVNNWYRG